ncbi:MAG: hypothetical protein P1V97_10475 [Planctomycetota bacterium]|nr:hypothetical protein [Planctomycetota bacterium]
MVRGFDRHQERQSSIQILGKTLSKNARFQCEWCDGKDELRPYDTQRKKEPTLDTLLFLCEDCRNIASGGKFEVNSLRNRLNGLWSERNIVKETLAVILVESKALWAIEAVENTYFEGDFQP